MSLVELDPVDRVEITILMDNVTDPLLVDQDAVARINWPKALMGAPRDGHGGLVSALGRTHLPVMIHPEFWNRRRLRFPGLEPAELPATSRSALEGMGFAIVEERQPSFLLDGAVLITGEVDRVADHRAHGRGARTSHPALMPAHCTGWSAVHRIATRFPDAFVMSTVGTTITL